jgi:GGDEF domain-containing protein
MMASFGIASYPEDGSSIQEIIGAADEMMYNW